MASPLSILSNSIVLFFFPILISAENFKDKVKFYKNKRISESLEKLEVENDINELLEIENVFETQIKEKPNGVILDTTPITIAEIELLRNHIHSCLSLNVGVTDLRDIKPEILIIVNKDRTVNSSSIINKENLNDPSFRIASEASLRAVNDPNCSPLNLPIGKYDQWKEIIFTFDYSWMYD